MNAIDSGFMSCVDNTERRVLTLVCAFALSIGLGITAGFGLRATLVALSVLAGVFSFFIMLIRPSFGFFVFSFSLPFGPLVPIPGPVAEWRLPELVVVAWIATWLMHSIVTKGVVRLRLHLLAYPLLALAGLNLISLAYGVILLDFPFQYMDFFPALKMVFWLLLFNVTLETSKGPHFSRRLLALTLSLAIFVSLIGFLQYFNVGRTQDLLLEYFPREGGKDFTYSSFLKRITSTFDGNPAYLAMYLGFVLAIDLAFLSTLRKSKRLVVMIMAFPVLLALYLTISRTAYIAVVTIVLILLFVRRDWLFLVLVGLALVFLVLDAPPEVRYWVSDAIRPGWGYGITARLRKIQLGLSYFRQSPIFGIGPTTSVPITTDNQYLRHLIKRGILGLGAYLWLLASVIGTGWKLYISSVDSYDQGLGLGMLAIGVCLVFFSVTYYGLESPRIGEAFWYSAGLIVAAHNRGRELIR